MLPDVLPYEQSTTDMLIRTVHPLIVSRTTADVVAVLSHCNHETNTILKSVLPRSSAYLIPTNRYEMSVKFHSQTLCTCSSTHDGGFYSLIIMFCMDVKLGLWHWERNRLRMLRRIFGPKRDGVTGQWGKLHNEELNDLYKSPSIVQVIKSRRMRWARHVARMEEGRGVHKVLVGETWAKETTGDTKT